VIGAPTDAKHNDAANVACALPCFDLEVTFYER